MSLCRRKHRQIGRERCGVSQDMKLSGGKVRDKIFLVLAGRDVDLLNQKKLL